MTLNEEKKYLDAKGLEYYTKKLQKEKEDLIKLLSEYSDSNLEWKSLGKED